jgi:phthiodiolone/phenolphthiodiolone dimycocerosates ketoreductase
MSNARLGDPSTGDGQRSLGADALDDGRWLATSHGSASSPPPMVLNEGTLWNLPDAFLGNRGKDRKPRVITMGGRERLINAALAHADGIAYGFPLVAPYADDFGEFVSTRRMGLAKAGRDPEDFDFGAIPMLFVCGWIGMTRSGCCRVPTPTTRSTRSPTR